MVAQCIGTSGSDQPPFSGLNAAGCIGARRCQALPLVVLARRELVERLARRHARPVDAVTPKRSFLNQAELSLLAACAAKNGAEQSTCP